MTQLWQRFQKDQERLSGQKEDLLNKSRHEIYDYCVMAAGRSPEYFL